MIKYIITLFSIFILLLFQNVCAKEPPMRGHSQKRMKTNNMKVLLKHMEKPLSGNEINITQKVPITVKAGSEFNIEITVNKGQLGGFAKLHFELPQGFTASEAENKTSSFAFTDQRVKFIWISLPPESEFTVIYKIKVADTVSGFTSIKGAFSYIENNDKKVYTIPPISINIEGGTTGINLVDTVVSQYKAGNENTGTEANQANIDTSVNVNIVECFRKIDESSLTKREFTVELTIKKNSNTGFAKLQETIPNGFIATAIEVKNGVFSFTDQKAKFLWMNLPEEKEFKVSYKVKVNDNISGSYYINGEFVYIENEETKKFIIPQNAVVINSSAALVEKKVEDKSTPEKMDIAVNKPKTEVSNKQNPEKLNVTPVNKKVDVTKTPAPKNGVNYRIQVAAGHTPVESSYFKSKYGIPNKIYTEMHEGWIKYTVGGFPEYKLARDNRESIIEGYKIDTSPFVAAYNDGIRITVQEALMITNQQWYK